MGGHCHHTLYLHLKRQLLLVQRLQVRLESGVSKYRLTPAWRLRATDKCLKRTGLSLAGGPDSSCPRWALSHHHHQHTHGAHAGCDPRAPRPWTALGEQSAPGISHPAQRQAHPRQGPLNWQTRSTALSYASDSGTPKIHF